MNPPKLRRDGSVELILPQMQRDYEYPFEVAETDETTVDGTLRTDFSYFKHGIVLAYPVMTNTEYNALMSFLKTATTNLEIVEFQFEKIPEYSDWVEVKARIEKKADFVHGQGTDFYIYRVNLVIKEVNAR